MTENINTMNTVETSIFFNMYQSRIFILSYQLSAVSKLNKSVRYEKASSAQFGFLILNVRGNKLKQPGSQKRKTKTSYNAKGNIGDRQPNITSFYEMRWLNREGWKGCKTTYQAGKKKQSPF